MFDMKRMCRHVQTYFLAFAVGFLSLSAWAVALQEIPTTKSLQTEIATAVKSSTPLLIFVSLDNCPYCKLARENYVLPLMNERAISIVQINFRHSTPIVDARGNLTTQDQLIRALGVKVAPTVLFLGKDGKEVAPRLVGGSTSDFYGAYLHERLDQATKAMQAR
jgi:thioredoxin-related protein